jgi:hypothetical protein
MTELGTLQTYPGYGAQMLYNYLNKLYNSHIAGSNAGTFNVFEMRWGDAGNLFKLG